MVPNTALVSRLSAHLRSKRDFKLRDILDAIYQQQGQVRILDMGGTQKYWRRVGRDFLSARNVTVTVLNSHDYELSHEEGDGDLFIGVEGDACHMPEFADNQFDLVHSNSVIEHLYTWENMQSFADETHRLAPYYYVQTPYYWFPVEPHFYRLPFFHWMPRWTRIALLRRFSLTPFVPRATSRKQAADLVDYAKLFNEAKLRRLYPDGELKFERFAGLRKSMVTTVSPPGLFGA